MPLPFPLGLFVREEDKEEKYEDRWFPTFHLLETPHTHTTLCQVSEFEVKIGHFVTTHIIKTKPLYLLLKCCGHYPDT